MPDYNRPAGHWLGRHMAQQARDTQNLKAQATRYVIDPAGVCQLITGNLQFDSAGNPTGLGAVWGIASFKTGSWVRL